MRGGGKGRFDERKWKEPKRKFCPFLLFVIHSIHSFVLIFYSFPLFVVSCNHSLSLWDLFASIPLFLLFLLLFSSHTTLTFLRFLFMPFPAEHIFRTLFGECGSCRSVHRIKWWRRRWSSLRCLSAHIVMCLLMEYHRLVVYVCHRIILIVMIRNFFISSLLLSSGGSQFICCCLIECSESLSLVCNSFWFPLQLVLEDDDDDDQLSPSPPWNTLLLFITTHITCELSGLHFLQLPLLLLSSRLPLRSWQMILMSFPFIFFFFSPFLLVLFPPAASSLLLSSLSFCSNALLL